MKDRKLYEQLLGIGAPWSVRDVQLRLADGEVLVQVAYDAKRQVRCPQCGRPGSRYDTRKRQWRHLDTMQFRTLIETDVPRVNCTEHGVRQVQVPWADANSRLSALFEALVIDWLHEASMSVVARQLGLSWDEVAGVQARAVRRGLERREALEPRAIGVDETSFQKRHEYVTVVNDTKGRVLYVGDDRTQSSLDDFYEQLGEERCEQIEVVTMDMWPAYINSTHAYVPDAESKIVFDKFHIAKHLSDVVDKVRRTEHRELKACGDERLKGSKYLWLQNPYNMGRKRWGELRELKDQALRVSRAWAIKEFAM
jgi:transposase